MSERAGWLSEGDRIRHALEPSVLDDVDNVTIAQQRPPEPALQPALQPASQSTSQQASQPALQPRMSRLAAVIVYLVVVVSLGWVLFSWRVLRSPLIDAVGEAAGSVFLALLIVSVLGALRRSRKR